MKRAESCKEYEFQFHKGTIETHLSGRNIAVCYNFNSIKVRLKPSSYSASMALNSSFQFHKGTIETHDFRSLEDIDGYHFNSIKVRLKQEKQAYYAAREPISIP